MTTTAPEWMLDGLRASSLGTPTFPNPQIPTNIVSITTKTNGENKAYLVSIGEGRTYDERFIFYEGATEAGTVSRYYYELPTYAGVGDIEIIGSTVVLAGGYGNPGGRNNGRVWFYNSSGLIQDLNIDDNTGLTTSSTWQSTVTDDGAIYLVGETGGYGARVNGFLAKISGATGSYRVDWARVIEGPYGLGEIRILSDGSVAAIGTTGYGASWISRFTIQGDLLTSRLGSFSDLEVTQSPPPAISSYTISPSASSINEGDRLASTVSTTNVSAGTKIYWALGGTGITQADFKSGDWLTGFGTVNANGTFSFTHTLENDKATEGNETLEIRLFSDAERTKQVGTTSSVIIVDSSQASKGSTTSSETTTGTGSSSGNSGQSNGNSTTQGNPGKGNSDKSTILEITPQTQVTAVQLDVPLQVNNASFNTAIVGTGKGDKLTGTSTADAIAAGAGKNQLTGSAGADAFIFESAGEFGIGNADVITDFKASEGDKITISKDAFGGLSKIDLGTASGSQGLKKSAISKKSLVYERTTGSLYFNENGKQKGFGDGGLFAVLQGAPVLGKSDFVLI